MKKLQLGDDAVWKARFWVPGLAMARVARAQRDRGVIVTNRTGAHQLYGWEVETNELWQLTKREGGLISHHISPDGKYIYVLQDEKGNEIGHWARFTMMGGEWLDVTPDLPLYSPAGFSISHNSQVLGFTAGWKDGFHVYTLPLHSDGTVGEPNKLYHHTALLMGPSLSADGQIAVVATTEKTGKPDFALLAFDVATGEKLGELWDGEDTSMSAVMFSPVAGDGRLLATTNVSGFERLFVWHTRTGERVDLDLAGLEGSVNAHDWSLDGRKLLVRTLNRAMTQLYVYDFVEGRVVKLAHPAGTMGLSYFMPNDEIFAHRNDSRLPQRLVALDEGTGEQVREVLPAGEVPPGRVWESITIPSTDGEAIQVWLARPEGEGPFPTIIDLIGGPTGVKLEHFSASGQAWLDHGFAWASVNYRGCSTFGRDFQNKIVGDLGNWEVEDIVTTRNHLVQVGMADASKILLTGWSYGGYLTLMSLSKYPDLWAGGMAGITIADWTTQYEDTADTLRGFQTALLGGTPEEVPEQYAKSSPITYAERVQAPILIIQGKNDTRTPARPVVDYERKMKELGKDITVHWFDSGHSGGASDVNKAVAHQELLLKFAYRVLQQNTDEGAG